MDFLSSLTFPGSVGALIMEGFKKLSGALEKEEVEEKENAKANPSPKDEYNKPAYSLSDLTQSNNTKQKNSDPELRKPAPPKELTEQDFRNPQAFKVP